MRAWFDVLTPKQVLFFQPVIESLRKDGNEVLATSRGYREVQELASMKGLDLKFVGSRGGKEPLGQLQRSLERMELLLPTVVDFSPDVAVSVASADCARISFGMRVKHIAVNDSPHSLVAGKLSLPLSHHLLAPWIIPYSQWAVFGLTRAQVTRYRALDPAAWLKRRPRTKARPRGGSPTVLVRVEESYAPYLAGADESWTDKVLSRLARDFRGHDLKVLCRYPEQLARIKKRFGASFAVPEHVVDGASLIEGSDVFVGMGGTMTTEAALLGVPAVSAYQGGDLYTEKFLASKRLLMKARTPEEVSRCVTASLRPGYAEACKRRARALLDWMEDPAAKTVRYLESLTPSA